MVTWKEKKKVKSSYKNSHQKVLKAIKNSGEEGLCISEIAERTGLNRETVIIWVVKLEERGLIRIRKIGNVKLCKLTLKSEKYFDGRRMGINHEYILKSFKECGRVLLEEDIELLRELAKK